MTFGRSALLAGFLCFAPVAIAYGQEVASPQTVEDLFDKLAQLQDANLGIARQIADTQRRAAAGLQQVLDDGLVTEEPLQKLAKSFIDNAHTLASVLLVPLSTQSVTTGETFTRLLRSNIAMLDGARPAARQNADLAGALEKYSVLQTQSEDLAVALANGWTRYGEVVRTAQVTGMMRPGSFDAADRSWTLINPNSGVAAAPTVTVTVTVTEAETRIAVAPEPALTGTPQPSAEVETTGAAVTLEPEPADATPRLDATGPLDVADLTNGAGRIGDWEIEVDGPGLFAATSMNVNSRTADRIESISIACGENGTLVYVIDAKSSYGTYSIYSDDAVTRTVRAESNIVSGQESAAMADTLRLAYDWAVKDPKRRLMTVSAVDDDEVPAQFSASGYMEARGRVLDACVQSLVAVAMGTSSPAEPEAEPAAEPATEKVAETAPTALPEGAVIKPGLVAPVPHVRPKTFKKSEKSGPIDIMTGN